MPPLIISLRIAGTDPERFYTYAKDDVGGDNEDNAGSINRTIKFTMKNAETGVIVGLAANVAQRFTGFGVADDKIIGTEDLGGGPIDIIKTILRYNWQPPALGYDSVTNPNVFPGDTGLAGTYTGEFEIIYEDPVTGSENRKRTFPSTPGDTLIINVVPDLNDKRDEEAT